MLDVYFIAERVEREHKAVRGTTAINVDSLTDPQTDLNKLLSSINKDIKALTSDAPSNEGDGFKKSWIFYQWSNYPLPLSVLEYFQKNQSEFRKQGLSFSASHSFHFYIHRNEHRLKEYENYLPYHETWASKRL